MPTYCYKTKSGCCEGTKSEVSFEGCCGKFERNKSIKDSAAIEYCRACNAELIRDYAAQGAPGASFVGSGFYCNDKLTS